MAIIAMNEVEWKSRFVASQVRSAHKILGDILAPVPRQNAARLWSQELTTRPGPWNLSYKDTMFAIIRLCWGGRVPVCSVRSYSSARKSGLATATGGVQTSASEAAIRKFR
jgi:hypothetical protein